MKSEVLKCPLCGYEFSPSDLLCSEKICKKVSLCRGCSHLCCPNCGYKMAGESKIVNWFENLFKKTD